VALGLDQGGGGDAWGYALAVQRVTRAAPGLPWPHYFVDLSGVGGSADPAGNLVVIAACSQLAPSSPAPPGTSAPPSGPPSGPPPGTTTATGTATGTSPNPPASSGTFTPPAASATATPNPGASPSASAGTQGCLRPELVALDL
jgi:hypothetical protein